MLENLNTQRRLNTTSFGSLAATPGLAAQPAMSMPSMQAIDPSTINNAATDSYIGQRLTSFSDIDPLLQYGVTIPTWIALNQVMEQYNKLYRGDYSASIVSKIGNAGDKISNFLFDNSIGRSISQIADKGRNFFNNKIYKNSALIRAFDATPSAPELSMVKHQMGGMKLTLPTEAMNVFEEYLKPLKSGKDFDSLGASKDEIARIEDGLSKIVGKEERNLYLQTEEFKFINKKATPQQIHAFKNMEAAKRLEYLQELKVKSLGFANMSEFHTVKAEPAKYTKKIMQVLENNMKKYSRISYSNKNFGTVLKGEIIGRKVQFSEIYNKLYAAMGGNHTTKLGRSLAKISNYVVEGATNRIAGGKVAAIIHAFFLAEILIRANRQEGAGNKFKSFMERYAELIGFFVFMGPSVKLMHKIGGMQYSGMTKEQIEVYRRAVKEFNDQVMKAEWTKDIYKAKRKELRAKFRPRTNNPFVYLARKCADVVTVGLEQVRPYTKHKVEKVDCTITKITESPVKYFKNVGKRMKDVFRNPKYWFKQAAGYPVRFILPMAIFLPFMNKYLVKGTNAIFGKPTEGALADEGKEEAEKENAHNPQQEVHYANRAANSEPIYSNGAASYSDKQAQISYRGKSTDDNNNDDKSDKPVDVEENRYIPSSTPVQLKNDNKELDAELQKILKRANYIEKVATDRLTK